MLKYQIEQEDLDRVLLVMFSLLLDPLLNKRQEVWSFCTSTFLSIKKRNSQLLANELLKLVSHLSKSLIMEKKLYVDGIFHPRGIFPAGHKESLFSFLLLLGKENATLLLSLYWAVKVEVPSLMEQFMGSIDQVLHSFSSSSLFFKF